MSSIVEIDGREIRIEGRFLRVARPHGDKYRFLERPQPVVDALRTCGARVDLFTFMQKLSEVTPKYSYPMEWDNLAALRITSYHDWWTQQIDCKTRNMVRKAERKGVVVQEKSFDYDLVQGIWRIYNESPIRQGKHFPHYGKDAQTVYREEATHLDCSIFIGAYLEDTLIGFMKLVVDETQTQAGVMNLASLLECKDKAPANALIAQAVRLCAERNISYLTYSSFSYGQKQRDSLSDFKRNNGFEKRDLPRYYQPFTALGWMAFRLGLHHRFSERVPELLSVRFRQLRSSLYSRRL